MKSALAVVFVLLMISFTAALAEPTYIGAAKCKMCHKVEYESWAAGPHATALDKLKDEDKAKAECLDCHATGASAEMPGVQCESCHGPGSDYKSMKVMKDKAASEAAGLVVPTEETCKRCHAKAPHEVPAFDFAKAKEKGIHAFKKPK